MPQAVTILLGAAFTVAVMVALGKLLLRSLGLSFSRDEDYLFAFASGAACLSLIVFLLACVHAARASVFLVLGVAALLLWRLAGRGRGRPPYRVATGVLGKLALCLFAIFTCLYVVQAMAPVTSPDGTAYHLGLVSLYVRKHGLVPVPTDMYAHLSQGVELLYVFAFSLGKHSAASLVHFSFLLTLALAMFAYARRFGFPAAGATGALLVYLSPIVGWDGSTAYTDLAVTCELFVLFYLLQIWDEDRRPGLLILIGLLAGFGYAMKYTAFVAIPYAAGFVAWKTFRKGASVVRPVARVSLCALVMVAPWVLRNWIWYGNPFSPFCNQWFPNPYVHVGLEQVYRGYLANWGGLKDPWQIPVEAAVRGGKLQGILGPVFLLAPIALLALRYQQGRQLLLAAGVYLSTYPANIGTRFLIPPLPFVSLAMGLVLMNWRAMAPLVIAAHALSAWPPNIRTYGPQCSLRLFDVPIQAALRIEPEERYLERTIDTYSITRMIEDRVPSGAKVFEETGFVREAYTSRQMVVSFQAALNNNLSDSLDAAVVPVSQPTRRLTFRFSAVRVRRVRVMQLAGRGPGEYWSISEFRMFAGTRELRRDPSWRILAHPNPFEVDMAFDGNPMTRWRSWQPISGGEYVEVEFSQPEELDSVLLDTTPDQEAVRLRLEGQQEGGPWGTLAAGPLVTDIPLPPDFRRRISGEMSRQGIEYLLIDGATPIGKDLRANAPAWGVTPAGENQGKLLYRIE